MNITVWFLAEVCFIGLLTELVPIGRENALATYTFKSYAESSYTAEEIDKAEWIAPVGI